MPIISSVIKSRTVQADGRIQVTESHTDQHGVVYDIKYTASSEADINDILLARGEALGLELDRREAIITEAHKFDVPLSQIEFLKRFTSAEHVGVNIAKKTDPEVEMVWNYVMAAINGIYLSDPVTVGGLMLLEAKGLLEPGRKEVIGAVND